MTTNDDRRAALIAALDAGVSPLTTPRMPRGITPGVQQTLRDVANDLLAATAQLRKASDALAESRAANTIAIARLTDVETRTRALLAVLSIPLPEGDPS